MTDPGGVDRLLATAGLIALVAISPGPNTLFVLRASARGGWRHAIPGALGILAGGLALVVVVVAGLGGVVDRGGRAASLAGAAAGLLLAGYALAVVRESFRGPHGGGEAARRAAGLGGFAGLFLFQLLNPKAWLLVLAAAASMGADASRGVALAQLGALFVLIPALSLGLWSLAGSLAMRALARPAVRVWFDRATAGLLIGLSVLLIRAALDAL